MSNANTNQPENVTVYTISTRIAGNPDSCWATSSDQFGKFIWCNRAMIASRMGVQPAELGRDDVAAFVEVPAPDYAEPAPLVALYAFLDAKLAGVAMQVAKEFDYDHAYRINRHVISYERYPETVERINGLRNWKQRELGRFSDGTYSPIPAEVLEACPWVANIDQHHQTFAHVALKKPHLIAFTASTDDGIRDRQTSTTFGRYLERYRESISTIHGYENWKTEVAMQEAIAAWNIATGAAAPVLTITQDADEIQKVYEAGNNTGTRSCMSYPTSDYDTNGIHPTRVYAGPDLALAYLKDEGGIVARCVVWPEEKIFSRIYGSLQIKALLEREGFKSGQLRGARVQRIAIDESRSLFVMPYIDSIYNATDAGDYIVLDDEGPLNCQHTHGLTSHLGEPCAHCGDHGDEDEMIHVEHEGNWCSYCAERYAVSDDAGTYFHNDYYTYVDEGSFAGCVEPMDEVFYCNHSGYTYHIDDSAEAPDGELVAAEHLAKYCEQHGLELHEDEDNNQEAAA